MGSTSPRSRRTPLRDRRHLTLTLGGRGGSTLPRREAKVSGVRLPMIVATLKPWHSRAMRVFVEGVDSISYFVLSVCVKYYYCGRSFFFGCFSSVISWSTKS